MHDFVVAVDLGGTDTKFGYATIDGAVHGVTRRPTEGRGNATADWLAEQLVEFADAHPGPGRAVGFGVVVPGIIDLTAGVVRAAPNLGWTDLPLLDVLSTALGLPGALGHDVRYAGLAEWRLGGGQGVQNLLFLPLGTGIAGAMIVDGRALDADGYAGEIGHTRVPASGELLCACGQVGCLEIVASASGVARTYARLTGQSRPASEVAELARAADEAAVAAFGLAAEALSQALLSYLTMLGPERIVIGGGLAASADLFLPQIRDYLTRSIAFQRLPEVTIATLGADAGVIGAGFLGWDKLKDSAARVQGVPA